MKFTLLIFTMLITSLISTNLLASPRLPSQYPLKKILITVSSQSSQDDSANYQVSISGNGNSFFSKNKQENQPLNITSDTLLGLLNDFYTIHFFEIKDTFTVKEQVILKDNKTVTTIVNKEPTMSKKKICIHLRSYKKCVNVVDNQPLAVAQIVNKIETLLPPKP
jgi:hypothetical protein